MPINAVEISLITLILFFTSGILISFFRIITSSNNYNQFVLDYISNNVNFCINYAYLYKSDVYCQPSKQFSSIISGLGSHVYVQYGNIVKTLSFINNPLFIPIYGVEENSFFLTYYTNNTNTSEIFIS
ncbi:hypothetical protein YN1_6030 [Nanoarchaeota archaeon]